MFLSGHNIGPWGWGGECGSLALTHFATTQYLWQTKKWNVFTHFQMSIRLDNHFLNCVLNNTLLCDINMHYKKKMCSKLKHYVGHIMHQIVKQISFSRNFPDLNVFMRTKNSKRMGWGKIFINILSWFDEANFFQKPFMRSELSDLSNSYNTTLPMHSWQFYLPCFWRCILKN